MSWSFDTGRLRSPSASALPFAAARVLSSLPSAPGFGVDGERPRPDGDESRSQGQIRGGTRTTAGTLTTAFSQTQAWWAVMHAVIGSRPRVVCGVRAAAATVIPRTAVATTATAAAVALETSDLRLLGPDGPPDTPVCVMGITLSDTRPQSG